MVIEFTGVCFEVICYTLPAHIEKQFVLDTSLEAAFSWSVEELPIEETLCFMGKYFWVLYLPPSRSAWTPITEGRRNDLIRL